MSTNIDSKMLSAAISAARTLARGHASLPVFNHVLFTGSHALQIVGATGEAEIIVTLEHPAGIHGCVETDKVAGLISRAGGEVHMAMDTKRCRMTFGGGRYWLPIILEEDFPRMGHETGGAHIALPQRTLRRMLGWVARAMPTKDIRHYLNGVLLELRDGRMHAVATDGHRLAVATESLAHAGDADAILPHTVATALGQLLGDFEEPVEIEIGEKTIRFDFGAVRILSKVVDGKFPNWRGVIPETDKKTTVSGAQFAKALERLAVVVPDWLPSVKLTVENGLLTLEAQSDNSEALEKISVQHDVDRVEEGFNIKYLRDAIHGCQHGTVEIHTGEPGRPAIISSPDMPGYWHLVMPMRL